MYLHFPMLKIFYYTGLILSCTGLIIYKLYIMNENLNQIKADLQAANEKADKIQADVTLLHSKIDAIPGDVPTAEEWAEVKALSTDLNNKLQGIDDQTAEETV